MRFYRLDCTATAEPEPKMTWFYNDKEIMSNERVQIIYDKETTTLKIPAAKIEDTGDYTCKAVNELGQSSTKTFLRVKSELYLSEFNPFITIKDK